MTKQASEYSYTSRSHISIRLLLVGRFLWWSLYGSVGRSVVVSSGRIVGQKTHDFLKTRRRAETGATRFRASTEIVFPLPSLNDRTTALGIRIMKYCRYCALGGFHPGAYPEYHQTKKANPQATSRGRIKSVCGRRVSSRSRVISRRHDCLCNGVVPSRYRVHLPSAKKRSMSLNSPSYS